VFTTKESKTSKSINRIVEHRPSIDSSQEMSTELDPMVLSVAGSNDSLNKIDEPNNGVGDSAMADEEASAPMYEQVWCNPGMYHSLRPQ